MQVNQNQHIIGTSSWEDQKVLRSDSESMVVIYPYMAIQLRTTTYIVTFDENLLLTL